MKSLKIVLKDSIRRLLSAIPAELVLLYRAQRKCMIPAVLLDTTGVLYGVFENQTLTIVIIVQRSINHQSNYHRGVVHRRIECVLYFEVRHFIQ